MANNITPLRIAQQNATQHNQIIYVKNTTRTQERRVGKKLQQTQEQTHSEQQQQRE